MARADSGPTRSSPRSSTQAIEPPADPIDSTSTVDCAVMTPCSSPRWRRCGSPLAIRATSKLVPPASPQIASREAGLPGDLGGGDDTGRRPRRVEHQRRPAGLVERDRSPVRLQQEHRHAQPLLGKRVRQRLDAVERVAAERVQDCDHRPLVLPDRRVQLGAGEHRDSSGWRVRASSQTRRSCAGLTNDHSSDTASASTPVSFDEAVDRLRSPALRREVRRRRRRDRSAP